jgi:hypothetical protein
MNDIPTRKKTGNQAYPLSPVLAHNLNRKMQMLCHEKSRTTTEKQAPLWRFEQLGSVRHKPVVNPLEGP